MKSTTRVMTILALLTTLQILTSPPNAQAASCTWIGGSGNWNDPMKWSCGVVPGAADDATISSGTVTLTEDASVGSLTLSSGTLTGAGNLTAGTINWSAGTMSGSGSTTATTAANFTGSTNLALIDRTFNNAGAATWNRSASGFLSLQTALTVFNNLAGATFTIVSSGPTAVSGVGKFGNAGTLTKSSLGGSVQISAEFVNAGTGVVAVESGTLLINNGDPTTGSGGYDVDTGATLRLSGQAYNLTGDIAVTGGGTLEIVAQVNLDGTLTFPQGVLSLPGNGTLTLSTEATTADVGTLDQSGGTLAGPGDLTAGTINWSNGMMSGSGSTTAAAANFTSGNIITLNGRTFNNAGAATWNKSGSGYLNLLAGSAFNNLSGATFDIESSGYNVVVGTGALHNAGTLTKSSLGDSLSISAAFVNAATGVIEVESGTLVIINQAAPPPANSGGYDIHPAATLRLSGQAYNLTGNIAGTGEGTIEVQSTVNLDGALTFPGALSLVSGGTLTLSTDATSANVGVFNMSLGSLSGPGDLTAGTINWSAGTMAGSGSTTATTAANFTGTASLMLNGRTFNNAGAATWNRSGSGNLYFQNAATVFNNQAGATFTVQSSGPGITYGNGVFNNDGTLNLTTGKLSIATFTQSPAGITNLAIAGTTAVTDYSQVSATNVQLAGPLNVSFTGGYTPQVGDHFVLLSYSSTRTGDYSPVQVAPVADIIWTRYYHQNAMHLWAAKYRCDFPLVMR